ncbi:phage/plasmid primase, P4 family [Amedibacillus dolichus]|uniref:phage/plasmid primase, P4 family n=1 Tax=Amedibacillus dolichus TaxID=31971 RepID=UPI002943D319|nr:phage/plasmid primase, P4 family [Amedibacillus dolichus]
MNLENIPTYLKEHGSWCNWKREKRKSNITKVPYNPKTGKHASVNNPNTFADYDTAVAVMDNYDGIGIRVDGKIIAIDLDHCIENENLKSWASEIVFRFRNTYIEKSPSGTGLRIILFVADGYTYDKDTYYIKKGDIEVYVSGATNRFVTITGDAYFKNEIVENMDALKWLLEKHMKRKNPKKSMKQIEERESYLTDDSVVSKAMSSKQAEKFHKLWNGDISDYPSNSEADLALVSILAFYCNGNRKQVDRLYRQSALARSKWDETHGSKTYGEMTIDAALSNMKSFYSPIVPPLASDDFNDSLSHLENMNPEDTHKYPWTDIGSGMLFADFHQDKLRYVPERKSWFYYEEGIWQQDIGGLKAMKLCMELANLLHLYALKITDEHKRKDYISYTRKWQSHSCRVNILKDAQVYHPISATEFDIDPYVFNCKNGTLHLTTFEFTEHCSLDKLTKISPVLYDPQAHSDRWDTFIAEIMSGDKEKAKFLQKLLGYGLAGDTRYECMTILYGASTRNGKGTLCESVLKVLGSYGCTARPETLAQKNNTNSSQPSEDIARLAGVRFVNISEPGKGLVLNAAQVKNLTGNDTINARFLHENSFDFEPSFKLYINTNYLPVVNDMTVFTSNRLIIIPFERHFNETEQDKTLKKEFAKPEIQSAILNWLLEGYALLRKEGLSLPQSVKDATARYQHDSDKMILFMEDCMEQGDYEERTSLVYQRYKMWCMENGHYAESMKNFKQSLETVATVVRKRPQDGGNKTTMITGYRLLSEFLD